VAGVESFCPEGIEFVGSPRLGIEDCGKQQATTTQYRTVIRAFLLHIELYCKDAIIYKSPLVRAFLFNSKALSLHSS
jgi:hypothetical protein